MVKDAETHADEAHKLREVAEALKQRRVPRLCDREVTGSLRSATSSTKPRQATIEGKIMELKQVARGLGAAWGINAKSARAQLGTTPSALAQAIYAQAQARWRPLLPATVEPRPRPKATRSSRTPTTRWIDEDEAAKPGVTEDADVRQAKRKAEAPEGVSGQGRISIDRDLGAVEHDFDELLARVGDAESKRDEYLRDLQRLAADFDNYRKRALRDQQALAARANERLVFELLPILDDLERALDAAEVHDEATVVEGVRLVQRALQASLEREGLAEIDADGAFDPHVHEALLTQPGEGAEPGSVLQVVQKGYRLGDRVLRPARVVVAE